MAKVVVSESHLEDIADAIRAKNGTSDTYTPAQMATAISNISGGGSSAPTLQTKSVSITPSETAQSQTVTADAGYDGLDEVSVSVSAISNSYVGSGITQRSSTDLSVSNATVTAPAGYYASSASKAVASGTAGTPTATKGTVSNHSISVTPSVTNTTGYIIGGAKTGTAVSVSASELVSGNKEITENGTGIDVANYSTVSVAVPSSGGSSMNVQAYLGQANTSQSSYTATSVTLTVEKTGTYTVSWCGWRNTTSGTSGSQLYRTRNGSTTAIGSANTSFSVTNYGQRVSLSGQSFQEGDVLTVYARARNTSYYMYVANLVIVQTA